MTIFVLPGMGADSYMYKGAWDSLSSANFINWPNYQGEKTLSEIALRIIKENSITIDDQLVGSSMGGVWLH